MSRDPEQALGSRAHDAVQAKAAIAAHPLRLVMRGQFIEQPEQTRQRVAARVLAKIFKYFA